MRRTIKYKNIKKHIYDYDYISVDIKVEGKTEDEINDIIYLEISNEHGVPRQHVKILGDA